VSVFAFLKRKKGGSIYEGGAWTDKPELEAGGPVGGLHAKEESKAELEVSSIAHEPDIRGVDYAICFVPVLCSSYIFR
jgi:hypothetical protein